MLIVKTALEAYVLNEISYRETDLYDALGKPNIMGRRNFQHFPFVYRFILLGKCSSLGLPTDINKVLTTIRYLQFLFLGWVISWALVFLNQVGT